MKILIRRGLKYLQWNSISFIRHHFKTLQGGLGKIKPPKQERVQLDFVIQVEYESTDICRWRSCLNLDHDSCVIFMGCLPSLSVLNLRWCWWLLQHISRIEEQVPALLENSSWNTLHRSDIKWLDDCPSHVPVQTNFRRYFCYISLNQAQTHLNHLKVLDKLWSKVSLGFNNRWRISP